MMTVLTHARHDNDTILAKTPHKKLVREPGNFPFSMGSKNFVRSMPNNVDKMTRHEAASQLL
jgi:hypothetical protein